MKVNVFKGARRISLLLGIAWCIGCVVLRSKGSASLQLETIGPISEFVRTTNTSCLTPDSWTYVTPDGFSGYVSVNLCFRAHKFAENEWLIPYAVDSTGHVWGNRDYTREVKEYTESRKKNFVLAHDQFEIVNEQLRESRRDGWLDAIKALVFGSIAIAAITWLIGWIVRGFLEIPRGHDRRSDPIAPPEPK